jgi:O-antigen ligase
MSGSDTLTGYSSSSAAALDGRADGGRSPRRFNAVTVLTVYLFLLFFIPYDVEFTPLGGSGTPSTMFAATLIVAYLVLWLEGRSSAIGKPQPVRTATLLFGCAFIASYISANRHQMAALYQNGADRGLISLMGWLGVVFIAADGIDEMGKLKTLVHRVVLGAGVMALIGVSQFFLKLDVTKYITIPGFANVVAYADVTQRSGLPRPSSTTATPLELVAVLAMVLPLAIHRARYAPPGRRRYRWLLVATIAAALPMTISRTAILVILVIAVVMLPTWPKRERRAAYLATPVALAAGFITIPGMLGTFAGILSNNGSVTASTQSRTNAYSSAVPYIAQHPWFGSGFGTFPPETYFFTDNQYLNSTIVMGFVGLLALAGLFVTGWVTARNTRRLSTDLETRDLAQALAASIAAAAAAFATFDALSFDIATGLTFLVLGCIGCLWRLVRAGESEGRHCG